MKRQLKAPPNVNFFSHANTGEVAVVNGVVEVEEHVAAVLIDSHGFESIERVEFAKVQTPPPMQEVTIQDRPKLKLKG